MLRDTAGGEDWYLILLLSLFFNPLALRALPLYFVLQNTGEEGEMSRMLRDTAGGEDWKWYFSVLASCPVGHFPIYCYEILEEKEEFCFCYEGIAM